MKQIAKLNGYVLKFHPSKPIAFALPNASDVTVVLTDDWKPIGKLANVKYPRELGLEGDVVVVSGLEGHIGIYELTSLAATHCFKLKGGGNDSKGLFVHAASNHLALTAFYDGILWVNYLTKESRFCFQPTDEFGFGPFSHYVHASASVDRLITLCRYSLLIKDEAYTRSMAHVWSVRDDHPVLSFDVLPKPSQREHARECQLGIDNTLIVSNNWGNRLLGWDLATGNLVFDNPKLTHGGESSEIVYAVLPKRRLIAVGSNGYIDFWNSDLSNLVYQFDSGKRKGYDGDLTVSADERHLACCYNGKLTVYEIPAELCGT